MCLECNFECDVFSECNFTEKSEPQIRNSMEWIKVEDRLPINKDSNGKYSEDVLITDGKNICVGYYESEYFIDLDPDAYEGQREIYSSADWWSDRYYIENVTHWMPLPPAPKE